MDLNAHMRTFSSRYHVGRHVANLQVTNTYEGASGRFSFTEERC